jgi:hypothetical protein
MPGLLLGLASFALAVGAWAEWMRRIQRVAIPHDRRAFVLANGLAAALGVAAFVQGAGWLGGLAAGLGLGLGVSFLGLRLLSGQVAATPAVQVGGPILDFVAPDEHGTPFDTASLRGRPYLLKFFRGHW